MTRLGRHLSLSISLVGRNRGALHHMFREIVTDVTTPNADGNLGCVANKSHEIYGAMLRDCAVQALVNPMNIGS